MGTLGDLHQKIETRTVSLAQNERRYMVLRVEGYQGEEKRAARKNNTYGDQEMNSSPKISIILPVYNKSLFLRRCLKSITRQMTEQIEVIIVDDGATDGSSAICDEMANKKGFRVYHIKHGGVSKARNYGLDMVKGEYVTFIDADDSYTDGAINIMLKYADAHMNIVQFNHFRFVYDVNASPVQRLMRIGDYNLENTPKYWPMVWNKLYKRSFLEENKTRFIEGMQFGEDEMFNVDCYIANKGLHHAPDTTINHYFDDKKSLCRGELDLNRILILDNKLYERLDEAVTDGDEEAVKWLEGVIDRHHHSKTFRDYGYRLQDKGRYDVVYFVKNCDIDEELRYSLRSLEENWKFRDVWFYGGCPKGLRPDHHIPVLQDARSKFENVRNTMREVCTNNAITEDFWLFNDDFFILKPVSEDMPPQYNGDLYERIVRIEDRHGQVSTTYTKKLRHLASTLRNARLSTKNYAVHKPMLVNRKKMLEVLDRFPDEPMIRALYGNYWGIGGVDKHDMKIELLDFDKMDMVGAKWEFVSTSDDSFNSGNVGRYLKAKFGHKSRYEK